MITGMTRKKIAITLPEEQVAAARRAVAEGRSPSVSAYISQALARRDADEELAETVAEIYAEAGTSVIPLDQRLALRVGARCAVTGVSDVTDVSVALCARDRGHPVVTSDPDDIHAVEPSLRLLSPT